jgi:hypothetical protein
MPYFEEVREDFENIYCHDRNNGAAHALGECMGFSSD